MNPFAVPASQFSLVDFLGGAVAFAFIIAGVFFLRFWRTTRDGLFLSFAMAFWLLAANRILVAILGDDDERTTRAYVLRVLAFLLILLAIARRNFVHKRQIARNKTR
jgi:hypothetical protein